MKTVYMFDVDGTLTPARQRMKSALIKREKDELQEETESRRSRCGRAAIDSQNPNMYRT